MKNFFNRPYFIHTGSVARARVKITGTSDAQKLQDLAAERCSMPYRAPELWNVESYCVIDERTDIWVNQFLSIRVHRIRIKSFEQYIIKLCFVSVIGMFAVCNVLLQITI